MLLRCYNLQLSLGGRRCCCCCCCCWLWLFMVTVRCWWKYRPTQNSTAHAFDKSFALELIWRSVLLPPPSKARQINSRVNCSHGPDSGGVKWKDPRPQQGIRSPEICEQPWRETDNWWKLERAVMRQMRSVRASSVINVKRQFIERCIIVKPLVR